MSNAYITATWRDEFILSSEVTNPGERSALYRAAATGRFVRVAPGAYLPVDTWADASPESRHLWRMRAAALTRTGLVFSHTSAALAWNLPIVGAPSVRPHVLAPASTGGRSNHSLVRHVAEDLDDWHEVDGLRVTAPLRTGLDMAATAPPESSVPILDALVRERADEGDGPHPPRVDHAELLEGAARLRWGQARGNWAVEFADGRSANAGESLSRVTINRIGFPAPELQVVFTDRDGLMIVDFWWPEFRLIGEFDGLGKYLRDLANRGRTSAEIVIDEKKREDRLRALGPSVTRWGWDDARKPGLLRARLLDAGLRPPVLQSRR